jgi:UDP-2,4-diacetamido-2,4,6-trideoxy-beta-L-altropyranose hydrolase
MKKTHLKIQFRVDGSSTIGLGHLVRCIALAQMLKNDFEITFICREIPKIMIGELDELGFNYLEIENEFTFINKIKSDNIIVLDGYHFDTAYQQKLKATGAKLVCIDDMHNREFVADLIINHAPGITPQDYKTLPFTQFALGLDYALLRPVFLEQAKNQRTIKAVETVMICFGGSDNKNLTQSSLQATLQFSQFKKIIVITGSAFQITDNLKQMIGSDNRIDYRHALNEQHMLDAMLESDLAIVPASGILFEVLSAGCIVISGKYVDNQSFVYENLKNEKFFHDAGNFESQKLSCAIFEILSGFFQPSKSIDGQSSLRISRLFIQLHKELLCNIRCASPKDVDLTFKWATNPDIRRYSFQKHQITKSEHTNWFLAKVNDSDCHYLIMEYNNVPIGSIRFDICGSEAVISYLLDPAYQRQGFGLIILKKGIEWLLTLYLSNGKLISVISGAVLRMNISSIKTFERLGFLKKEQMENFRFEKWI